MVNILNLSDIHLGHDRNKTEDIVLNLRRFFKTYNGLVKKADLLIISGDIFDKLLTTNSLEYHLAYEWLTELVLTCRQYGVILRILEGTPSHDWKQAKLLHSVISSLNIDIDFEYKDELSIEYIADLRINILYIPDEWKPNLKDVYVDVIKEMHSRKLEKVDIIVMHGAFSYQLPEFLDHVHDPDKYNKLSYGPVITGHVHKRSVYGKIIVPGSFDGLDHSDDGVSKGGLYIEYNEAKRTYSYKFLDNKYALLFKTLDVREETIDDLKKLLNKFSKKTTTFVRLLITKGSKLAESLEELKKDYSHLRITTKKEDSSDTFILKKNIQKTTTMSLDRKAVLHHISTKVDEATYELLLKEVSIIEKL